MFHPLHYDGEWPAAMNNPFDYEPHAVCRQAVSEALPAIRRLMEGVGEGKEYIICRAGKPVALLSPYSAKKGSSRIGLLKGKLKFGADWWERDQSADAEIEKSFSEG